MVRYIKTAIILILVLSLLSGCEIKKPFKVTHSNSEGGESVETIYIDNRIGYMDAYEGEDGKYRSFSVTNSYESFDIVEDKLLLPNIFCVDNDYIYYSIFEFDEEENFKFSVWKKDINGGNENKRLVEISGEYKLLQIAVDDEKNLYVFIKDDKDKDNVSVSSYYLNKYDTDGNCIWSKDVTDALVYDYGLSQYVESDLAYRDLVWWGTKSENETYKNSSYDVTSIYINSDGDLDAASRSGVATFNTDNGELKNWFRYGSERSYNTFNSITGIVADNNGVKYINCSYSNSNGYERLGTTIRPFGWIISWIREINNKGANINNTVDIENLSSWTDDWDDREEDDYWFRWMHNDYVTEINASSKGLNYDFLIRDREYIRGVDLESKSIKKLFAFANVGVIGVRVIYSAELPDGRILIIEEVSLENIRATIVTPGVEDDRKVLSLVIYNTHYDYNPHYDVVGNKYIDNYLITEWKVAEFNRANPDYRIIAAYYQDLTNEYDESKFDIISTDGKLSGDMAWLLDDYEIEYDTYSKWY